MGYAFARWHGRWTPDGALLVYGAFLQNRFVAAAQERNQPDTRVTLLVGPTGAVTVAVRQIPAPSLPTSRERAADGRALRA